MAAALVVTAIAALGAGASPALAETHPFVSSFGSFTNPNGIAVEESTGDVYVADIGTDTVSKFDAHGNPVDFSALGTNALNGSHTPAGSFAFPSLPRTPAAIAIDNSTSPLDPSRGDLYVMDAGHGVIDKFSPSGEYLGQITGFEPATGSAEDELLGLAVDASGTVRADLSSLPASYFEFGYREVGIAVEEFDDTAANHLIAHQLNGAPAKHDSGLANHGVPGDGFAVGPTGDDYMIFSECSCTAKLGQQLSGLGLLDNEGSADVAVAADPATGHVYVDDASSVAEWDGGALNGSPDRVGEGVLVSRFGEGPLTGSSGQGGIAVDGATGAIYVANPADGKVYVFASNAPAVSAGVATNIIKEAATLNGTVDPRGAAITSCEFEYGVAEGYGRAAYEHKMPCEQTPGAIGTGASPVAVSAAIKGLTPDLLYRFRLLVANATSSNESDGLLAAQGTGFGIKNFEVSFLNENGTPDTQAGSHPYEFFNNIEFNWHYVRTESNADSPYVREPNGTLRNLTVDLPQGFVGDPNATAKKCTLSKLYEEHSGTKKAEGGCPSEAVVGSFQVKWDEHIFGYDSLIEPVYNMATPPGVALQLGINYRQTDIFINNGLLAGGDYPVQATVEGAPPEAPVLSTQLTLSGVLTPCVLVAPGTGKYRNSSCTLPAEAGNNENNYEKEAGRSKAFLTMPTGCHGPLRSTIAMDSYEEPSHWVHAEALTRNSAGTPVSLTGCSKLIFPPTISVAPDTTDASTSSGLTVGVHVPQTAASNPDGLAESSLRDTTVTLPEGVALNPAGADGLEACSEGLAGFRGFNEFNAEFEPDAKTATFSSTSLEQLRPGESFCPDGSKIGTVKIKAPLLEHELEGAVYLASQNANPFGSLVAMYLMVEDPISGSTIKLTGEVSLNPDTGQIVTTFDNTPDLPFENLELHFFGGERAPLTTPSRCGTYTTQASFVPWDGNGPVNASSSFQITSGPNGSPCPGGGLPFGPSLTAGTTSNQAGGFTPFTMTMSRADGQQNLQAISLKMPPGLSGLLTGVELCGEAQANAGTCSPNSQIGETIVSVGVGSDPYSVTGGKVYLTGPYKGAQFGLSIVNPAVAGPYNLGQVVVRAKIEVNPITADLTVTSDNEGPYKIPTMLDGIPLQIQHVNVTIDRPGFTFNPTNCSPMAITGRLDSTEGASDALSVPFQATNCASLKFEPKFAASTSGKTSRTDGASLSVKLTYPSGSLGKDANIKSVKVDLPKQLPSRLTTLQKACPVATFEVNPASCPADSKVGHAKALTPLIPVPLEGPAYFVSHGGAKFPELIVVLQGYGVTLNLHGETFISKAGITSSTFHTVPDAPVGSFELTLPEGKFSALAANGNLCKSTLAMPTAFVAQNGAEIHQSTKISVTGCAKSKKTKKAGKRSKVKKAGKHSKRG
jgi:DNA-binding beta-propeller fold protein YncE